MARLTNAQFVDLGRGYKADKADEAAAKKRANEKRDALLADLRRRGKTSLELDGVIVTRKAKQIRIYALAKLRAALPARLFDEVAPPTIKISVLDELVKTGKIDGTKVAAALDRTDEGAAYIDVTLKS